MTLNYVNADVRDVIRSLTTVLGLNVLIAEDVPAKRVTYSTPAPVPFANIGGVLEAILESEGLVLINRGSVAQVALAESAPTTGPVHFGKVLPAPRPVGIVTQVVPLDYISPDEAIAVLGELTSPLARLEPVPRSNGILITDHASNVARYLELLQQLDAQVDGEAGRRTYVYRLRHATAIELAATLAQVYGVTVAQVAPRPRVQALSDRSLSNSLDGFRRRDLESLETRRANPFPVVTMPAATTAQQGSDSASATGAAGPGSATTIVPDQATNALVIRTEPPNYPILRETIEALDVRPAQVLLEVQVAEVRLDDATQYGINWSIFSVGQSGNSAVAGRLGAQNYTDEELQGVQDLVLRAVRLTDDLDVRGVIRALAAENDVSILSTPHIVALNNEEARILVGSQVPFTQSTRAGLDVIVDQTVQYRDVGVQLTVIPTINDDGYVTFRILQEVSALTTQTVDAALGASVISTREAETSALVRNGQTVIIGGLIDEADEVVETGVPVLKDVPLLGYLFKSRTTRKARTELAIFVTPYLILTDEDADALYERARNGDGFGTDVPPDTSQTRQPPE
ncbi:MAG: secretin N-terminal domain-containing protein [Gemmatimonadales bacterium]|jgi:general secretion pathway protein D